MRFFKIVRCLILILSLLLMLSSCVMVDHFVVRSNYKSYNQYVLHDNVDNIEKSGKLIEETVNTLPRQFSEMLQTHWIFIVVRQDEFDDVNVGDNYKIDGSTEPQKRIIRLNEHFSKETVLHECGHAIDAMLNFVSHDDEFYELYRTHWSEYLKCFTTDVGFHEVMNSSEFFAAMFQQYILQPEMLKEHIPAIFSFFEEIKDINCNVFIKRNACETTIHQDRLSEYEIEALNKGLTDQYIVPTQSQSFVPGNQSALAIEIIGHIIDIINNEGSDASVSNVSYRWTINSKVDYEDYQSIVSFFEMYYGVFDKNFLDITTNNFSSTMTLYMDVIRSMEAERKILTKNIGNLVSTMYNGDASAMAVSFAKHINTQYNIHMNYIDKNMNEIEPGSDISAYNASVLFQKMCEASGLRCDIISGYIDSGVPHVWNRILIEDGSYRYFDVYFYYDGIVNVDEYHYAVDYAVNWMVSK